MKIIRKPKSNYPSHAQSRASKMLCFMLGFFFFFFLCCGRICQNRQNNCPITSRSIKHKKQLCNIKPLPLFLTYPPPPFFTHKWVMVKNRRKEEKKCRRKTSEYMLWKAWQSIKKHSNFLYLYDIYVVYVIPSRVLLTILEPPKNVGGFLC